MNPTCSCAHKDTCWLGDVCHARNHNSDSKPECYRAVEPPAAKPAEESKDQELGL